MTQYVAAIDQGTTSTRCMIFDHSGQVVAVDQKEHEQIFPKAGWVEHDPAEIWVNTRQVCGGRARQGRPRRVRRSPRSASPTSARPRSSGTRPPASRSTTPSSGRTRAPTGICEELGALGGGAGALPREDRPAAGDLLLRPEDPLDPRQRRRRPRAGRARRARCSATMDTWVLWNMTGGTEGGLHVTDPTNASRTLLMNLDTLEWDPQHLRRRSGCRCRCCPRSGPPRRTTARSGRAARSPACRSPASSATSRRRRSGRPAWRVGEAKNTYGTGNFVLLNTGTEKVRVEERPADDGLLQDRRRRRGLRAGGLDRGHRLAGAVAARQPRDDRLGAGDRGARHDRSTTTAAPTSCRRSPGLFAPYWRSDARGAIVGLTRYVNKGHLARAVLEATAFQTREVIDAMNADSGVPLTDAEGRRRHGRQRAAHAVPGRHARRAGDPARGRRDHRAGRRLRGRARRRLLEGRGRHPRQLGQGQGVGPGRWTRRRATRPTRQWKKAVTRTFDWV